MEAMLEVAALRVAVEGVEILHGIDLTVRPGEVHAIMGPNGSGKSTFAQVLAGHEAYVVTGGSVRYRGDDLFAKSVEDRARAGVFLALQYPVEIPGVSNAYFLKAAVNAVRASRGEEPYDAVDFLSSAREHMQRLKIDEKFLNRSVNEGFSGGEKKRNEVLQMAMLQPALAVLDETDSGLDIDALRIVADGVNSLRRADRAFVVVTHYQRLLDYVVPDYVHVLAGGRIVRSGDKSLATQLEDSGYAWVGTGNDENLAPDGAVVRPGPRLRQGAVA